MPKRLPSPLQMVHFDHIGIAVSELQESITLYERAFGLRLIQEECIEAQGVKIAMLSSITGPEAAILELLEAVDEQSPLGRFVEKSGTGLHHLALRVDNLEEAVSQAQGQGLEMIGQPQRGSGNSRVVFLHPRTTGGVLIELLERDPI